MKWYREPTYYIDSKGVLCCRYRNLCMLSWKDDIFLNIEYRYIGAYKNLHNKPTIWHTPSDNWRYSLWPIQHSLVVNPVADLTYVDDIAQFIHSEMGHDFSTVKLVTYAPQDLKKPIREFIRGRQ